jgi:hypothetical protein
MYESRIIAADAESILPLAAPRALEGDFPASLNKECASTVVIRSSQVITGRSVAFRNRAQKALTFLAAGPRDPSSDNGRPTTIPRASCSFAAFEMFAASADPAAFIASNGVAIRPVGSLMARPIRASP